MDSKPEAALIESLQTPGTQSKKYTMSLIGIGAVLFVFVVAVVAVFMKPEISGFVSTITPVALVAVGGMVSVFAGVQAAVDYKTTQTLAKTS